MKSNMLCAFMIVMILVSSMAIGEILTTGEWEGWGNSDGDWTYSSVSAHASNENYSTGEGMGWQYVYTTEDCGDLQWYYFVYTYASCEMFLYDNETCSAAAIGDAYASCKFSSDSLTAFVYMTDSGTGGRHEFACDDDGEPFGIYKQGTGTFYAMEGVSSDQHASTDASAGSDCTVHAHGCVQGWGNLAIP